MLIRSLFLAILLVFPVLGKNNGYMEYAKYALKRNTEVTEQVSNANNATDVQLHGLIVIDKKKVYQTTNLSLANGSHNPAQNITAVLDMTSPISQFLGVFNKVTACQAYVNQLDMTANGASAIAAKVLNTCKTMGVVDVSNMDSFTGDDLPVPPPFSFADGSTTYYQGTWVINNIAVGSVDVPLQYALSNVSNSTNLLGLGLTDSVLDVYPNSTNLGVNGSHWFHSFPCSNPFFRMDAYSLYLNNLNNNAGELLFGGVDKSKYTGELYNFPIMSKNANLYNGNHPFSLVVGAISFFALAGEEDPVLNNNFPGRLDINDRYLRFPDKVASTIAAHMNATWNDQVEHFILDCPTQKQGRASLGFDFGGFRIFVPLHNMIIPAGSRCALAIQPHDKMQFVLGQPFMSSAYFVFDLMREEISIAQANYRGTKKPKIKAIRDTVPGAITPSGRALYMETLPTAFSLNVAFSTEVVNPWTATKYKFQTVKPSVVSVAKTFTTTTNSLLAKREAFFSINHTSNSTTNGSSSSNRGLSVVQNANKNLLTVLVFLMYFFL